jgi:hypothetical protein
VLTARTFVPASVTTGVACSSGDGVHMSLADVTMDGAVVVGLTNSGKRAWEVDTGHLEDDPPLDAELQGPDGVSPDGTMVTATWTAGGGQVPPGFFDLAYTATGIPIRRFGPHLTSPAGTDFSDDGARILSWSGRGPMDQVNRPPVIKVWMTETAALEQSVPASEGSTALFHPDNQRLFVTAGGSIVLWCR